MCFVVIIMLLLIGGTLSDEAPFRIPRWTPKDPHVVGYYSPQYHPDKDNSEEPSSSPLPSSFDDFVPGDHQPSKSRFNYQQVAPSKGYSSYQVYKVRPNNDWKGYSSPDDLEEYHQAPWAFKPSDLVQMVGAIKHLESEQRPTGLFSKITAEPLAVFLVFTLPLAIVLASTVPALLKGLMGHLMGVPTVTTVAAGGREPKREQDGLFGTVMGTIEDFDEKYWHGPTCLQRSFCRVSGGVGEFREHVPKIVGFFGDSWLVKLGVEELMKALDSVDCQNIHCSNKKGDLEK